jgi:hypothetical protein
VLRAWHRLALKPRKPGHARFADAPKDERRDPKVRLSSQRDFQHVAGLQVSAIYTWNIMRSRSISPTATRASVQHEARVVVRALARSHG